MIRLPSVRTGAVPGLLAVALLGGCAFGGPARSHSDQATEAACRTHASQVYDRNNRGSIYNSIDQTGVPYSGSNYGVANQTNALAEQYANQRLIDDCIRNTGTTDDPTQPETAPSGGAASGGAAPGGATPGAAKP